MPYPYFFEGGFENCYVFETENKFAYEIIFRPSGYLLESKLNSEITENVFEFIIKNVYKPENLRPPLDSKIPLTVGHIFHDFFKKIMEPFVSIFVIHLILVKP